MFSIHMDPLDFQTALKEPRVRWSRIKSDPTELFRATTRRLAYIVFFTQDIFVTPKEAEDRVFLRHLTKGRRYRVVFVCPKYIQTKEEAPASEHCYIVPHWLSEKVERGLSLSLLRFRRDGDRFHVFTSPKLFTRVMERSYCEATQEDGPKRFSQLDVERNYHYCGGLDRHHSYHLDDSEFNRCMVVDVDGRELYSLGFGN